jgi:enoyl-CoA hydratase/carnithine racemase/methionyl-tRNA formyltransferase
MKILFLCTAHNSLSQRLYLALATSHDVTIEYALSDALMITAAQLAKPDLIICPFLTARVPKEIYNNYLTLIIHPGPPGDAGPSALDWLLMGDDGSIEDPKKLLESLDQDCKPGRSHWGITILQAIEQFDAGPVWAFEQFSIDIDQPGLTKSELYRGPVSRVAISACIAAIKRIHEAAGGGPIVPSLKANPDFKRLSVLAQVPFRGGKTCEKPLLKAAQRDFIISKHNAKQISRRIRCGDSQPGSLSKIFGQNLYLYCGIIDECPNGPNPGAFPAAVPGTIVAVRKEAICILTCDGRGIWITHIRRPKRAQDSALWPKVPAVTGLLELGILQHDQLRRLEWELPNDWSKSSFPTFQEIWIDYVSYGPESKQAAFLYFDFYNGAMSTDQCSHLIEALEYILTCHKSSSAISALVLMGGTYFSNGIALNVIEASSDPAQESWLNINRINDVVFHLLHSFRSASITTIAALRGNAAAGGVAFAAACDIVIAGTDVVLNPAYRSIGLYGSEYHTISYFGRCGETNAQKILRSMTPLSPLDARTIGLVDHILPGNGAVLDKRISNHVAVIVRSGNLGRVKCWKSSVNLDLSSLARARALELGEMSRDFWSARATRYHTRRFAFIRKVKATHTPLRFARHSRVDQSYVDEEERDTFDDMAHYQRLQEEKTMADLKQRLDVVAAGESRGGIPQLKVSMSSESTKKSGVSVFSCYYSSPELVATPSGGMSTPSSVNGGDQK